MKRAPFAALLVVSLTLPLRLLHAETAPVTSQESAPSLLGDKLPPSLQETGRALLAEADPKKRASLADDLGQTHADETRLFLLALLDQEESPIVRRGIIIRLGRTTSPEIQRMLERVASSDPDPLLSILALDRLRIQRQQELRRLLTRRFELARSQGDEQALRQLAQEEERWTALLRGSMLPGFLRTPPPVFSLKPTGKKIRVLAFGDYGTGSLNQRQVADAMLKYHKKHGFDFGITLGDNFYDNGLPSPKDPRWRTWWEDMYSPLKLKIYASLGNHDWGGADSPASEILYTSSSWRMPAPYYTFTAGPVQFFALDTNDVSEAQLIWLKDALAKSDARWKLVYGHHPIYSAGMHGDNETLMRQLLPLLRGRVDVYLAGHDHDLEHLKADGGVQFFISGGGGASIREVAPKPNSLWAKSAFGFSVIEADEKELKITYVGTDVQPLYTYTLQQPQGTAAIRPTADK